jgi:hypothetical protein
MNVDKVYSGSTKSLGIGFAKMGEELCVISKGKICFLTIGE